MVDNGSPRPVDPSRFAHLAGTYRFERIDPAPPSPARAANLGIGLATGETIGLIVDGARIASPGLLRTALLARRLDDRPVVASLGWHVGAVRHMEAAESGYDQVAEDDLLARSGWEDDGYRLFGISTLGGSSAHGWFAPIPESSALFLPASVWRELGGLDEAFALPGGGLVNHDLFRRAVDLEGTRLVTLLGEGTFHQYHGGAATSGRHGWDEMDADYQRLRGAPYRQPGVPSLYVGTMPTRRARPPRPLDSRPAPGWSGDQPAGPGGDASPGGSGSAHPLEEAVGVEGQRVALHLEVGHELRVVLLDQADRLLGTGTEAGPDRRAVHHRLLDHHVGPDGHERRRRS